jgi:hypothetical protein
MPIKTGGLRLFKQMVDAPLMRCLVTDSTPLGYGDAVKFAGSSGQIGSQQYAVTVSRVAAGDAIFGVVCGIEQQSVQNSDFSLSRRYRPASVNMYVNVRLANNQDIYAICNDGTWAAADVGENANLTGNGGGTSMTSCDTTTGQSTMLVDTSTHATGATLQVNVVGFAPYPNNDPASANADLLVRLNNVQASGGTGTAGV